jgi:hypothetical protein
MTTSSQLPGMLYVAVVHAPDGIRAVAGADSRAEIIDLLADYIRHRSSGALRADEARHLRRLLARGELEAAVEVYFGLVRRRRGEEWLVTAVVATGRARPLGIALGTVAHSTASIVRRDHALDDAIRPAGPIDDPARVA